MPYVRTSSKRGSVTSKRPSKCYGVKNAVTGHRFSKCTTKAKAQRQENLLRAVEHGWKPTGKK